MSKNVTLFQIFGTKLRLTCMFESGPERLLVIQMIEVLDLRRVSMVVDRVGRKDRRWTHRSRPCDILASTSALRRRLPANLCSWCTTNCSGSKLFKQGDARHSGTCPHAHTPAAGSYMARFARPHTERDQFRLGSAERSGPRCECLSVCVCLRCKCVYAMHVYACTHFEHTGWQQS